MTFYCFRAQLLSFHSKLIQFSSVTASVLCTAVKYSPKAIKERRIRIHRKELQKLKTHLNKSIAHIYQMATENFYVFPSLCSKHKKYEEGWEEEKLCLGTHYCEFVFICSFHYFERKCLEVWFLEKNESFPLHFAKYEAKLEGQRMRMFH